MADDQTRFTYQNAGVDADAEEAAMGRLTDKIRETFTYHPRARVKQDLGFFANVIDIGAGPWIAVTADGVGTKLLVAMQTGRHDTIGIDCVAMNVNDLLCVGADPVAMLDCLAISAVDTGALEQIMEGLREGASRAEVSIPGGELAQVKELLATGEGIHYDLVGMALGTVERDRLILGDRLRAGDVVVGVGSTGLHSNGYTLARKVLLDGMKLHLDQRVPELGRTLGEELLEPTAIYVKEVKAMLSEGIAVRGLANITGGGLANLLRLETEGIGFLLDELPEPQPVFRLIQEGGRIPVEEMYNVFNMGVGFCVVVPREQADRVIAACRQQGKKARVIGRAVRDPERKLLLPGPGLAGDEGGLRPARP